MSTKLAEFWRENDSKFLLVFAFVLIAFVAFRAGQTHQKDQFSRSEVNISVNPLAAANPHETKVKTLGETMERKKIEAAKLLEGAQQKTTTSEFANQNNCQFVGSRNSNKYHQPDCGSASKIKSKNLVCFSSQQEAEKKGYMPASCCH